MYSKFVKIFFLLITLNMLNAGVHNNGLIEGRVSEKNSNIPLAGVNIIIKGTMFGAISDKNGNFKMENIPAGKYLMQVQMIGYHTIEKEIEVKKSHIIYLQFELAPEIIKGEAIVVTGTRTPRYVKNSPVKTEVVTKEEIKRLNPTNFLEATQSIIGIESTTECSICNASSISIQGLPGRYTQVLIDGIPFFSSLGQTYGYMELPANFIDQLEIIKGANSVLYGSDAIAGIVNIRTIEPSSVPKMNLETQL